MTSACVATAESGIRHMWRQGSLATIGVTACGIRARVGSEGIRDCERCARCQGDAPVTKKHVSRAGRARVLKGQLKLEGAQ